MAGLLMTVPYIIGGDIGAEYNRIMKSCSEEWIGFLDHDIFIANPNWYKIFTESISVLGEQAGFISCMTNNIGCPLQKAGAQKTSDIRYHREFAEKLHREHNNTVQDVTDSQFNPSALMFITSKKAWYDVGGFKPKGLIGVDTNYVDKLKKKGYKIYLLKGLYVYHWYRGVL